MVTLAANIPTLPRGLLMTRRPLIPIADIFSILGDFSALPPIPKEGGYISISDWFKSQEENPKEIKD